MEALEEMNAETEIEAVEETTETVEETTEEVTETDAEQTTESDDDEVVVTIGEDSQPSEDEEKANPWEKVREVTKEKKALTRELKKAQEKLESLTAPQVKAEDPGVKPTLESCDYDEETFDKSLAGWYEQKRLFDEEQNRVKAEQDKQATEWQKVQEAYAEKKRELKVPDEIEQVVLDELNEIQQGILAKHAINPALVVLGLGNNPQKLDELAKIQDPIAFALHMRDLEGQTKVNKRTRPKVPPETQIPATGGAGVSSDKHLEALEAEADKTGDRTKILAYKRQLKLKGD